MEFLTDLWMPILVAAAFVWIASSIMHMVLPHHKSEWKGLPNEEAAMAAIKDAPPGQYMFPWVDMADMKDPQVQERYKQGPTGVMTIWTGSFSMGKNLSLSFLVYVVTGVFVAYVAWHAFKGQTPAYMDVFRITGACALMAYGIGMLPHMIWFRVKGFWTYTFDNLVYALLTAGVFGWLWPK